MSIDWSRECVAVTGGAAFTGSVLVERLLARGARVRASIHNTTGFLEPMKADIECVEGDLRDPAFADRFLSGTTRVFHFASVRKNVAYHRQHCAEICAGNVQLSLHLSAVCAKRSLPVVYCSSATVAHVDLAAAAPRDGYVLGKCMSELLWSLNAEQYGFPFLAIRPVAIYGPRDVFLPEGNVIPSLLLKALSASGTIDVWGSGNVLRSFVYVEDVVDALFVLLDANASGVQPVSSPETVTIRRLAELIRDLAAPGALLSFDASKPEGASLKDIPVLHPSLAGFSWTSLENGLRKTLDWYRSRG